MVGTTTIVTSTASMLGETTTSMDADAHAATMGSSSLRKGHNTTQLWRTWDEKVRSPRVPGGTARPHGARGARGPAR